MYIVLTALLALNISAEILNAFMTMDKSLSESNELVNRSNLQLMAAIDEQADAYSQFDELRQKAKQVRSLAEQFYQYVDELKTKLIETSGGYDEKGTLKGLDDKVTTTRLLVEEGRGEALEEEIQRVREELLELVEDVEVRKQLAANIPLAIAPLPEGTDKKTWAQFNFQQMPLAATLPMLSKFQNDAKVAETAILNYFLGKTDVTILKPDAFEAVVAADKSYVIRGEELSAEIFLGSYSSTADNISVRVDGRSYPVRNGKALFKIRPSTIGPQDINAEIRVTNPISGEVKSYQKKFRYEVGERSVTVSAEKMNVFYVGVNNPVAISAAGVASREVVVQAEGVNLTKLGHGKYMAKPTRPGTAKITVSGGGLEPTVFNYRVKPIPTPLPKLDGRKTGGTISPGEFKIYTSLRAELENFDFDARCRITEFELTRVPRNDDAFSARNSGEQFSAEVKRMTGLAKRGDTYYFEKIRAKCPGDNITRKLSSMVFRIR